jgi:hypothetical protein
MTGLVSKGNTIAIPAGFNPRDPASVAAALAALPTNGRDVYSIGQSGGAGIIGPALEIERLEVSTGPSLVVEETLYALTLPAETFSLATGGVVEMVDNDGPDPTSIVIYYTETEPVATDEAVAITGGPYSPSVYTTTTFQGELALATPSSAGFVGGAWNVELPFANFDLNGQDFTLEAWMNENSQAGGTAYRSTYMGFSGDDGFDISVFLEKGSSEEADETLVYANGPGGFDEQTISEPESLEIKHVCIQCIAGVLYWHVNGSSLYSAEGVFTSEAQQELYFALESSSVPGCVLGQLRLTIGEGIYGAGGFTPPSSAFYSLPE